MKKQNNGTQQRTQKLTQTDMPDGLLTKVQRLSYKKFSGGKTAFLTNGAGATGHP